MQPHLEFTNYLGRRIHLGVCGSVAAFKSLELLRMLSRSGAHVSATVTGSAEKFVTRLSFEALGAAPVYGGMFDHDANVFGHLDPGQDAHALVIAPATANALAKLAHGLADDMLSCQALAFPGPIVVAPAMNPRLWNAAATRENWETLKRRGVICIEPGCGDMACGEEGDGRFPALDTIYLEALKAVTEQDLAGRKVLLTLGPTREFYDCVRFWSNPSSGVMGASLAVAAWLRGADVTAVCGPIGVDLPESIERIDVTTAKQMYEAAMDVYQHSDWTCCTAAVADYSPQPFGDGKFKKETGGLEIDFVTNQDILATMGKGKRQGAKLIGFAAEASDLSKHAQGKLVRKNLDLIVANNVTREGCGFGTSTNEVLVHDSQGRTETWPMMAKTEVAWRIWDWMLAL